MPKKKSETEAVAQEQLKVVDTAFSMWDDAGFLSWLGIDVAVAQPEQTTKKASKSSKEAVVDEWMEWTEWEERQEKDKEETKKTAAQKTKKEQQEYIPSEEFRYAKVISRAADAPKVEKKKWMSASITTKPGIVPKKDTPKTAEQNKKMSNDVDALIAKKAEEVASEKPAYRPWTDKRTGPGAGRGWFVQRWGGGRWGSGAPSHGWWTFGRGRQNTWARVTLGQNAPSFQAALVQQTKKEKTYKVSDSLKKKEVITLPDRVTVKEFAEKMWVPLQEVMKVLLSNKIIVAAQASIDFDIASLVAAEFEVTVEKEKTKADVGAVLSWNLQAILWQDKEAVDLVERAPVVTIMGHVDHGKTRLLDYLRSTDVVAGEAGGITQSIGASQIVHNGKKLTFIDTPGHELFTSLRARGARITNIVVIVVAADDGVKPQTVEAINHAKDAGVPIIVAITKIDKGIHKMDEIKWQLAEHGLVPEEWGGDIMLIPLSAMTGQGVDDLLDAILLHADTLNLQYSPSRRAVGVVVEAHKDTKQWVTTSLILMTWTLRVGDVVVVHNTFGKVKRMMNRKGEIVTTATGGDPVVILGIQDLPEPGRVAEVVDSEKEANKRIELLQSHEHAATKEHALSFKDKLSKWDNVQIKLILKAESFGSLESLKYATQKVALPENMEIKIIHSDVGNITDSDLIFAQASQAIVIGYNVTTTATLQKKAELMKVVVKQYDIIYEFIDRLEKLALGLVEIEKKEVSIGKLNVLAVFFKRAKEMIIGWKVISGYAKNGCQFRVWRGAEQLTSGYVTSLQREKDSVSEVKEGYECGMKVKVWKRLELEDVLEFYVME